MNYLTQRKLDALKERADPKCLYCNGDGFYCITWIGNTTTPDREQEVACMCTKREAAEPEPSGYGWSV
jgi:hypothetical protein